LTDPVLEHIFSNRTSPKAWKNLSSSDLRGGNQYRLIPQHGIGVHTFTKIDGTGVLGESKTITFRGMLDKQYIRDNSLKGKDISLKDMQRK